MDSKSYTQKKFEKITPWFEAIYNGVLKAPLSLVLLVTDRCFNRCQMCTHWQMKEFYDLDYETFYSIMSICQRQGTQSVFLSGGDCFAWEHWKRFLKDERLDIAIQITTPLVIPKGFDLKLLRRLRWIRISFDGISPTTFKKVRGVNALGRVLNDLEEIVAHEIIGDIGMTTTLQRDNFPEIIEMGRYLEKIGIKRWIVQPVNYFSELSIPQFQIVELGKQLNEIFGRTIPINNFDVLSEDFKVWTEAKNIPCVIPKMAAFIDTRMRVWPCCNIAQDSMGDEERAEELRMGMIPRGPDAGIDFINLWRQERNYLDKFIDFKGIHPLCEYTCKFKYFYYNLGYEFCKQNREVIYI